MRAPYHGSQTGSSSLETERRLTTLEIRQQDRQESNQAAWQQADKRFSAIESRMSLHEKAILAIAGALQVVLQDKYPKLAQIIKGML